MKPFDRSDICIRFTHAIGNSSWKNGFDDDAGATSADDAESKTAAIVDEIYHFNLSPFRIQLQKKRDCAGLFERSPFLLKRKKRLNDIIKLLQTRTTGCDTMGARTVDFHFYENFITIIEVDLSTKVNTEQRDRERARASETIF